MEEEKFVRGIFLRVNFKVKKDEALKEAFRIAKEENKEVFLLFYGKTVLIRPTDSESYVRATNRL